MARRPAGGSGSQSAAQRLQATMVRIAELERAGRARDAIDLARRTMQKAPNEPNLLIMLAHLLLVTKQTEQAVYAAERASSLAPRDLDAVLMHAQTLETANETDKALARYDDALALVPNNPDALSGKGHVLARESRPYEAEQYLRRAAQAAPNRGDLRTNLGNHLLDNGMPAEACELFREGARRSPDDPQAYALLAYALNYDPGASADELFTAHAAYGRLLEHRVTPLRTHKNTPDPERTIRVGIVSRDLHRHSVAYFLEPILEHHDPERLHITCYAVGRGDDEVTARLRDHADAWRDVQTQDHPALVEGVRKDRIDVLIDLTGHFAGTRLPLFASRPAPVSCTYIGYPNTTGLTRITARLVDDVTDPAPGADQYATETLVRIPECFLCYRPFEEAPEPVESTGNAQFTFGSFNATKKYSAPTIDAWGEILRRAPEARLVLKQKRFAFDEVAQRVLSDFADRGVDADRIELLGKAIGQPAHLSTYHRLDLALDPFPYNGTTTTCEALWMGTPVLTLVGDKHPGRVGASLLATVGLDELVTDSVEDYIDAAVDLATNPERLSRIRTGLRARVAASPLLDHVGFRDRFEGVIRGLWRDWCANPV